MKMIIDSSMHQTWEPVETRRSHAIVFRNKENSHEEGHNLVRESFCRSESLREQHHLNDGTTFSFYNIIKAMADLLLLIIRPKLSEKYNSHNCLIAKWINIAYFYLI